MRADTVPKDSQLDLVIVLEGMRPIALASGLTTMGKTELVEVTPDKALEYLTINDYPYQRAIKPNVVRSYTQAMKLGHFKELTTLEFVVLRSGDLKNKTWLIDGQHRLHALFEADKSLVFNVLTWIANTQGEVERAYGLTDRSDGRTIVDAFTAMGKLESSQLNPSQLAKCSAAVNAIYLRFAPSRQKADVIFIGEKLDNWMPEIHQFYAAIKGGERLLVNALQRRDVMACCLIILRFQLGKATEFLTQIASGENLRLGDPAKAFRNWAINKTTLTEWPSPHFPKLVSITFAASWKCFYTGKELRLLRAHERYLEQPVLFKGTPYNSEDTAFTWDKELPF